MLQRRAEERFDLAVVGAGIVGLATALAAARRGLHVIVIDRDPQANGASVRNFGFITVTGQERQQMWPRARLSCETWREIAAAAAIPIVQRGAWLIARRRESVALLEAFMATDMAADCRLLSAADVRRRCPQLTAPGLMAVLESTVELRVESREAVPRLAAWLGARHGVTFARGTAVWAVAVPAVHTSNGVIAADRVVVCPGDDFSNLYAERLQAYTLTRCQLQMLRLASPGFVLPATLLSDLSLARYAGFADLDAIGPLKARLALEQAEHLRHGVHLIVAQSADGSLVVGDSHRYAPVPDSITRRDVEELILDEFRRALGIEPPSIIDRWLGTYASASDRPLLIDAPEPAVRIAIVTCGSGASTCFAIGEELVASLLDSNATA